MLLVRIFSSPPPPPSVSCLASHLCHFYLNLLPSDDHISFSSDLPTVPKVATPSCYCTHDAPFHLPLPSLYSIYTSLFQFYYATNFLYLVLQTMENPSLHQIDQIDQLSYENILIFEGDSSRSLKHDFFLPETHLESKASEYNPNFDQVSLTFMMIISLLWILVSSQG